MVESTLIICDRSPIGKNSANEAIRIATGFAALGEIIDSKVVFMGDAVYLLNKNSDPTAVGMDVFDETFEMADLSDLELFVEETALKDAGMTKDDLIDYENLKIISIQEISLLMEEAETIFRF